MRILFVTASYLPITNGVTYHIYSTALALRKLGHTVFILAPSFPGYKDSDKYVLRYPSLPNPFVNTYPLGVPIVPFEKIKKLKPDVIHTHHPFIVGQFAAQVAEKLGKPLFFTAHTQYEEYLNYYFPQGYNITSKIMIHDLVNLGKKSDKVICPTFATEARLQKHKIKNTQVIGNGIEDSFFKKPKNKSSLQPTLIFTGRIEKEKNIFFLLKIAQELKKIVPNFRLILIGGGSLIKRVLQKINQSGLTENIFLAGEINRSLLPDIYKSGHLFITPSKSEVMPLSILEAMGSGLPVLVLENSGMEELIEEGKNGHVVSENPKIVAQKISNILKDEKKLKKMSEASYEVAKKFSSQKTAKQLVKLYLRNTKN